MENCTPPPVDAFSGFTELRGFSLSGCDLRAVPPAMSSLTALEDLYLGSNDGLREEGGAAGLHHLWPLSGLCRLALPDHLTEFMPGLLAVL